MAAIILGYILVAIIFMLVGAFGIGIYVAWMCEDNPESVIGYIKDNFPKTWLRIKCVVLEEEGLRMYLKDKES